MRQAKVVNHLWRGSEHIDLMYIVLKKAHSFSGGPSVEVTVAVADDKLIMWRTLP